MLTSTDPIKLLPAYVDGSIQFAQSCGGGRGDSALLWGRNQDEDDRHFAYRCMMQAHKMQKSAQPKRKTYRLLKKLNFFSSKRQIFTDYFISLRLQTA